MPPKRNVRPSACNRLPVPVHQVIDAPPAPSFGLAQLAEEMRSLRREFAGSMLTEGADHFIQRAERVADLMRHVHILASTPQLPVLEKMVEALWALEGIKGDDW